MTLRRLFACTLILLLAAAPLSAGPMSDQDRIALLKHLDHSKKVFLDSVEGLSAAQLAFKPADDKWSITEVAEHLAISEQFIRDNVVEILATEPASAAAAQDDKVMALMADRSQKFQAPEPVQPTQRWASFEEALQTFRQQRNQTLELVEEAEDLRGYVGDHPAFGPLDAYGWLIFLSSHVERHTAQIDEIKADDGFPKM